MSRQADQREADTASAADTTRGGLDRAALDRAAFVLGVAALLSSLFALTTGGPGPVDLVHVGGVGVVVLLVLGAVAVAGGLLRRHVLVLLAGAGLVLAALLQLVLLSRNSDWLGGTASTMSLLGGLGLGLLAVGLTNRSSRLPRKDSH